MAMSRPRMLPSNNIPQQQQPCANNPVVATSFTNTVTVGNGRVSTVSFIHNSTVGRPLAVSPACQVVAVPNQVSVSGRCPFYITVFVWMHQPVFNGICL